MKKLLSSLLIIILTLSCASCYGYNAIMYDHLSEPENYQRYEAVLAKDPTEFESGELLSFILEEKDFVGNVPYNSQEENGRYVTSFRLCPQNTQVLKDHHFFEEVHVGDKALIRATPWIYMDTNFFYICAIEANGVEYLSMEVGIENMKLMMDENRSFF